MRLAPLIGLLTLCSSCSFVSNANEAMGVGHLDIGLPLPQDLNVLPHLVIDLNFGFQWHSKQQDQQLELELARARLELLEKAKALNDPAVTNKILNLDKPHEPSYSDLFFARLSQSALPQ